jgi:ribonuclease R
VAVLERRGRFLIAEPLFPQERSGSSAPRRGGSTQMTIGSSGSARGAHAGELVLVQPAGRGGGGGARASGAEDGADGRGASGRGAGGRAAGGGSARGARIVRVLGRPDVARDVIEALMLDRGLARGFDAAVEHEARTAGERARERSDDSRRDLRELPTFTIDPASARDFDDAISAEDRGDGVTRVWVHIADVAAHVREGSLLDREARRRATSVYVPGAVEPMLPHALSSDACSLMPGVERLAVTVELELRGAVVVRAAFYRSLIRSDERLDYERVDQIFAGAQVAAERKREHSGALVVDSEEPEFSFDERGNVSAIVGRVQTESHRLIEHLMIAANEAVASLLSQRGVPCLFRVHERPLPERIERLTDQLASLDVPTPALPEPMSASQAAELVGAISKRVDQHVRRTGAGRTALSSLVLRSLKQAYYSPTNLGHAGLHSATYCHFTSPIRRYPDLVCHRALLSAVGGGEREPRAGELVELGAWTSEREREAMVIERDADDVARCFALEQLLYRQGHQQVFAGEITGLISAGAFIAFGPHGDGRGDTPAGESDDGARALRFEGMLPVRHLRAPNDAPREWWELNEQGTILHGERTGATLRLAQRVDVRVARVDAIRGRVDLAPAS